MPLYRVDTDQGDELGLRLSDETRSRGDRIELDGRWYVVTLRHDLPPGDLLDAMLEVAIRPHRLRGCVDEPC